MGRPKYERPKSPDILRKGGAHRNRKRETGREPIEPEELEERGENERENDDEAATTDPSSSNDGADILADP